MAKFYLSSTYEDLKDYRERVSRALRDMGHEVVGMENYTASGAAPLERCLADVARCDAYIGIFAWRYGHIPVDRNRKGKSITELEYLKAYETLPKERILIFLLDENAPWPPKFIDGGDKKKRLEELRQSFAAKHLIGPFENCGDLIPKVMAAVACSELEGRANDTKVEALTPAVAHPWPFWPKLIFGVIAVSFCVVTFFIAHQIYLAYWPKPWGNTWSDSFTSAKKLEERWNYPKDMWATEPGESAAEIKDDEALLVKGREMGVPNDLGRRVFYNFTANFKVRFKSGATRAAWVFRAQRDRESGYLFELAQEGSYLVLSGWIYEHKQKVENLGRYQLPFSGLKESQGLYMDVKVEGNNFDYVMTFEDDDPDDTSPVGQPVYLHFQDDPSNVRWPWGTFGLLETDDTSVMRVEYLYIYPLL